MHLHFKEDHEILIIRIYKYYMLHAYYSGKNVYKLGLHAYYSGKNVYKLGLSPTVQGHTLRLEEHCSF